eukprot:PhF_6_TR43093/c0_g1_i1/m.65821/K01404/GP63; leishmanolysin
MLSNCSSVAVIIVFFVSLTFGHVCIHNSLDHNRMSGNRTIIVIPKPKHFHSQQTSKRSNIRILLSTLDLEDSAQFCSAAGQVRSTFKGDTATCTDKDVFTAAKKSKLLNSILPAAINFLSTALKVDPATVIKVPKQVCRAGITIPTSHTTDGVQGADYVLYVTAGPISSSGTVAWAGACAFSDTGRPIVGQVNFGPAALSESSQLSYFVKVGTHEIMHALGFSESFATTSFLAPNANPIVSSTRRGKTVRLIATPEVKRVSREHYGCSTLDGMELEDQGGEGTQWSHWDKRAIFNEVMVGFLSGGEVTRAVSAITLAYFQDSGHYTVDYSVADTQEVYFGRNAGCSFLSEKCNTVGGGKGTYWCFTENQDSCTGDRMAVGQCNYVTYTGSLPSQYQYDAPNKGGKRETTDYCPYVEGYSNTVCSNENLASSINTAQSEQGYYFGSDGRCFDTTDSDGSLAKGGLLKSGLNHYYPGSGQRCFRSRCVNGVLQINVGQTGSDWVVCPTAGGIVSAPSGFVGKIKCPVASTLCSTSTPSTSAPVTTSPQTPTGPTITPSGDTPSPPLTPSPPAALTPSPPTTGRSASCSNIVGSQVSLDISESCLTDTTFQARYQPYLNTCTKNYCSCLGLPTDSSGTCSTADTLLGPCSITFCKTKLLACKTQALRTVTASVTNCATDQALMQSSTYTTSLVAQCKLEMCANPLTWGCGTITSTCALASAVGVVCNTMLIAVFLVLLALFA